MAATKANGKAAIALRLAPKKVSFPTFLNAVGETVFGGAWPKQSAAYLESSSKVISAGSYEAMVALVRDDIVAALADDVIKVGFIEMIAMGQPRQVAGPDRELDEERLPDDPIPLSEFDFSVKPDHWLGNTAKSFDLWSTSNALVQHKHLGCNLVGKKGHFHKQQASPFQFISDPFHHKLYIRNPLIAWQDLFENIDLPDETWFDRYRSAYRSSMTQELVTAGWRYLAIEKPTDGHGIKAKIADAMIKYLHSQRGTDPNDSMMDGKSSIDNLADKLHKQWIARDLKSPVLLNSARASKSIKAEKTP